MLNENVERKYEHHCTKQEDCKGRKRAIEEETNNL